MSCAAGSPVLCAALDQCHDIGTCDPASGVCSNPAKPNGTGCNDGNACTVTDTCQAGVCTGDNPVICVAQDQCHDAGVCDSATGLCSNPPKADGTHCDDGNACTQADACQAGTCTGTDPVSCAVPDQCHDPGVCDPATGVCSNPPKPDGSGCNDGNVCTTVDTCVGGSCVGNGALVCDDGSPCNGTETCDPTLGCQPGTPPPVVCGDGIRCGNEECDDGNAVDGDGCESNCTLPSCGNGIVDPGEQCDDGNQNNCDGCSSQCRIEPAGASWCWTSNGPYGGYVEALAIDPTTPSTLYAGGGGYGGFGPGGGGGGGVFKSTDSGGSWNAVNTGLTDNLGKPFSVSAVAISPVTPSTLYAGTTAGGVFQSTDSGGSWNAVNTGLSGGLVILALAIDPTAPSTLYAGTGGDGVFQSTDSGANWVNIWVNIGLSRTDQNVLALAIEPTSPVASASSATATRRTSFGVRATSAAPTMTRIYAATNGGGVFTLETGSGSCGNGVVDAGEQCDDGNLASGDCCSSTCQAEDLGTATCGVGACARTAPRCVNGVPQTCAPGTPQAEICNGIDDDCDGVVDNGNPGGGAACSTGKLGVCAAGTMACTNGALVCNQNQQPSAEGPAESPSCTNGIDDDCDGLTDASDPGCQNVCGNGFVDPGEQCDDGNTTSGDCCNATCQFEDLGSTTCGVGACARTVQTCVNGAPQTCTPGTPGVEGPAGSRSCSNGIDDDCDGLTDASDPGCQAVCGNGFVDPGEQCDDGNTTSGDGCSATCQSELIPGGSGAADCSHEWQAALVPARNSKGMPMNRQTCTEGDPACDLGPAGDNACTFHVAMCFNVAEQRFACTPTDIARVQLLKPPEAQPRDATAVANRDALETALGGLQGVVRGQCTRPRAKVGQLCQANADCDSAPDSGDGLCKGRFVAFEPPLSTMNACTSFASINVPLRQTALGLRSGISTLKLKASPSNDPLTGRKRPRDTDWLTFVCKPRL